MRADPTPPPPAHLGSKIETDGPLLAFVMGGCMRTFTSVVFPLTTPLSFQMCLCAEASAVPIICCLVLVTTSIFCIVQTENLLRICGCVHR